MQISFFFGFVFFSGDEEDSNPRLWLSFENGPRVRGRSFPSVCENTVAAWELFLGAGVTSHARISVSGRADVQRLAVCF